MNSYRFPVTPIKHTLYFLICKLLRSVHTERDRGLAAFAKEWFK